MVTLWWSGKTTPVEIFDVNICIFIYIWKFANDQVLYEDLVLLFCYRFPAFNWRTQVYRGKKPLGAENQQTHPIYGVAVRIDPSPHLWQASALTKVSTQLPQLFNPLLCFPSSSQVKDVNRELISTNRSEQLRGTGSEHFACQDSSLSQIFSNYRRLYKWKNTEQHEFGSVKTS